MESPSVVEVAAVDLAIRFGWYAVTVLGTGVIALLGIIMFGRRYKERIASLEEALAEKRSGEGITIHGNIHIGDNYYSAEDGKHHTVVEGRGEIVSPTPVRVITGPVSTGPLTASVKARPTDAPRKDDKE